MLGKFGLFIFAIVLAWTEFAGASEAYPAQGCVTPLSQASLRLRGKRVFVFYNSHRNLWSVLDASTRKLLYRTAFVRLSRCTFEVRESGRQKVIESGQKNLHAGVLGYIESVDNDAWVASYYQPVRYDPPTMNSFYVIKDESPIYTSSRVILKIRDHPLVYAQNP